MGAWLDVIKVNEINRDAVKIKFQKYQDSARYSNGNDGYTGTLAECPGLDFKRGLFTPLGAQKYLGNNCQKWENAIAVLVLDDNKMYYLIGGLCSC
jgi:hypothetical protein